MQLVIATSNPGKLAEFQAALSDFECLTLASFPRIVMPEETGATFEENAKLKAKSIFEQTGIPALGDDAGLEIDALNGAPGVYSKRWAGIENPTDEFLVEYTLNQLEGIPREKRTARFRGVIVFYAGEDFLVAHGESPGYVIEHKPEVIEPGFPYRAVLFIPQFGKLYSELSSEEHEEINHRLQALKRLKPLIEERLLAL